MVERYELRRVLGRGGMGVVFEAHDRMLDQVIALKIVRAEYAGDRAWAERLAREVKLARQINHPNVCRVYDIGVAERHPFLTMELASRGTLRDEIASGRYTDRPLEERVADVRAVASGLAAIHTAGIIHRDVSPGNVLRLGDGALVVSDFGLATDRFDGTSSIQGGTLAYMAPEVVRGARASMASDIWSLGVLIHELLFGVRPRWAANGKELLAPELGRSLLRVEELVFQVCRASLAESPSRRPLRAGDAAQWLSRGMPIWQRGRTPRVVGGAAAIVLIAVATLFAVGKNRRSPAATERMSAGQPPIVTPTGVPKDWTTLAPVLTSVPGKINCMTLLPDRRTLRFVWGTDRRAEDVDIQTGITVQSPLVPAAYAEGCPSLTIRGDKMVFPGHDADEHPVAFVSSHKDGSAARAVVQIAEPSMGSDPAWFPDGDSFLYPIDVNHAAVYSMSSRTTTVVPVDTLGAAAVNYVVVGDAIIAAVLDNGMVTDLRRFWYPHMRQDLYMRIRGFALDATSRDDRRYYLSLWQDGPGRSVAIVDASAGRIEVEGYLPNQRLRFPISTPSGLAFVGALVRPVAVVSSRAGGVREVELDQTILSVSACGDGLIAMKDSAPGLEVVLLGPRGQTVRTLDFGKQAGWPTCSHDGHQVFYASIGASPEIRRCLADSCTSVYRGRVNAFELSPDDARIVTVAVGDDGFTVKWLTADGQGGEHDVTKTAVACPPEWSSNDTFWVSTRRGRRTEWKEFDVVSSTWTGRESPGKWDCTDGEEDPASPAPGVVRLKHKRTSDVRLMPAAYLAGR